MVLGRCLCDSSELTTCLLGFILFFYKTVLQIWSDLYNVVYSAVEGGFRDVVKSRFNVVLTSSPMRSIVYPHGKIYNVTSLASFNGVAASHHVKYLHDIIF